MMRKMKRFSAVLVAAAMAFSVGTAAFAEQATPETVQSDITTYADENADQAVNYSDTVAVDGSNNTYTSVQEAINANKGTVGLLKNVSENVTVTGNATIDFRGCTLTAADTSKPVINAEDGNLTLLDSDANKQGGTVGEIAASELTINSGVYRANNGPVISFPNKSQDATSKLTVKEGTFYGAAGQAVFNCAGNVKITSCSGEFHAGENGKIVIFRQDGTLDLTFDSDLGQSAPSVVYGELGVVGSDSVKITVYSGKFDHEIKPTDLPMNYSMVKDGDFWVLKPTPGTYAATITTTAYYELPMDSLAQALDYAAYMSRQNNTSYTVNLYKDVTENILLSPAKPESWDGQNHQVNLYMNGHTLTAADPSKAALSVDGTGLMVNGSIAEAAQDVNGTINGRVESNSYLWLVHTVVNASAGQPAVVNTSASNDQLAIKGRSIINGAAGQAVVVSNGKTSIGDEAVLKAGENGILFMRGESAPAGATCFDLSFCTLYGDLGSADAVAATNIMTAQTGCFVRFDRIPSAACIPAGWAPVKKDDGLYWLEPANGLTVADKKQDVASTVDTAKTAVPAVDESVPQELLPTQEKVSAKAEELKAELTGDNAAVQNFKDNNLGGVVDVKALDGVKADSIVELSVQVQLQDIQLGASVVKDADGKATGVNLGCRTLQFDVTPMFSVNGGNAAVIPNNKLNGGDVKFRLPIPAEITEKYAVVSHEGDADRYVEVKAENGKKYIELSATHFSVFTVSFTDELPAAPTAAPTLNTNSSEAQPTATAAPAVKQDDSAYYTCKACGYHDWTAIEGGYKCDHCGYVESVKQLAGYPNVKGTATVGSTAAAKPAKTTTSAIPQTADEMPVTALTVLALAALLGMGVTAAKRKQ